MIMGKVGQNEGSLRLLVVYLPLHFSPLVVFAPQKTPRKTGTYIPLDKLIYDLEGLPDSVILSHWHGCWPYVGQAFQPWRGLDRNLANCCHCQQVGWHAPELAKGVVSRFPRPSQAQGRATQTASSWQGYDTRPLGADCGGLLPLFNTAGYFCGVALEKRQRPGNAGCPSRTPKCIALHPTVHMRTMRGLPSLRGLRCKYNRPQHLRLLGVGTEFGKKTPRGA